MVKTTASRPGHGKRRWFAARQVYLRAGQDSQYVELSPMLQASVAFGFALVALWLAVASYGAIVGLLGSEDTASENALLLDELKTTKLELHATIEKTGRIPELETALADSRAALAEAEQVDQTAGLKAELEQTQTQLQDLRRRLSESKAEEAALQAKLDVQAAASETTAEEQPDELASSLHAQLEEAFEEIELLQKSRDEADAKLAAATTQSAAKDENASRNDALLKAATDEIERLQAMITTINDQHDELEATHTKAVDGLNAALAQEQEAKGNLEEQMSELIADFQRERSAASDIEERARAADAAMQSGAIAADLKEADLLATIDGLRDQIGTLRTDLAAASEADESESAEIADAEPENAAGDEVQRLNAELTAAHAEIETMLMNGLARVGDEELEATVEPTETAPESPPETKQLRSELALAQADIIKLRADVKAAKKRLSEKSGSPADATQRPDNTAKLEQQLASTRSRIQQLTKALSDAKLREVAIDLALINVVPSPSPPAPR